MSNWFQFLLWVSNFRKVSSTWLHTICTRLWAIPLGSTFSDWLWIFSLNSGLFPFFAEPSICLHYVTEPSSLAPEMSHLALFSSKSQVTWHQSCRTRCQIFECYSKIDKIQESCRFYWLFLTKSILNWNQTPKSLSFVRNLVIRWHVWAGCF